MTTPPTTPAGAEVTDVIQRLRHNAALMQAPEVSSKVRALLSTAAKDESKAATLLESLSAQVEALRKENEALDKRQQQDANAARLEGIALGIEAAAKACEKRAADRWEENGYTERDTNASYYPQSHAWCETADEEAEDCAAAIRSLSPAEVLAKNPEKG